MKGLATHPLIERARLALEKLDREVREYNMALERSKNEPIDLEARRAAAERKLRFAEAQIEADALRARIPAVAADLAKQGDLVHQAFAALRRSLPDLVRVQGTFDSIEAKAKRLRLLNQVIEVPATRRFAGLHREALAMVSAALEMTSSPRAEQPERKPR